MSKQGTMRLQKEFKTYAKDYDKQISEKKEITDNFIAAPDPDNIFEWYFVVFGLIDEPYKGGYYMGKLTFPSDYPWKPPAIRLITESGRFSINERICLSISDYHPESWNPIWPVTSVIVGLVSFFSQTDSTVGSISTTVEARKKIASASMRKVMDHKKFKELFESFKPYIGMKDLPPLPEEEEKKEEKPIKVEEVKV